MNYTGKKTKTAVILIIFTVLLAALVSVAAGLYNELHETYIDSFDYLENFVKTYDSLLSREQDEETRIRSDLKDIAALTVAAIKRSRSEFLPSPYADGAIVKVTVNGIESPIDLPEEITPDVFSHDSAGTYDTSDGTMIYCHIADDFYYLEMTDPIKKTETEDTTFTAGTSDVTDALEDLAAAHKCEYLYMKAANDSSSDYEIYCGTGQFSKYNRLSQLDISENDMKEVRDSLKTGSHHMMNIDGSQYFVRFITVGDSRVAAMLIPVKAALLRTAEQTVLFVAALLVVCIVISSWILFTYDAVENHTISLADRDRYQPRSLRIKTRAAVIIGSVLILISSLYLQSLESVFTETNNGSAMLTALFHRIDNDRKRSEKLWEDSQDRYTAMAERIALLIDRNRELQNRDWLREASQIVGAEFLMIFDTDGKEVISDSPYKGIVLGTSETDATYDFRRLLNGVKSISHANVKDEVIGEKLDMYGIALRFLADKNADGALILATNPKTSGKKTFADINEIAGSMMAGKAVCIAADPATGLIKYSSNHSLLGRKTDSLGLEQNDLREDYMGFIKLKGRRHYVISAEHDGLFYYYAVKSNRMLKYDLQYALIVSLLSLFLLAGLAHILLKGYRDEDYMASFALEGSLDEEIPVFYPTADELTKEKLYSFDFLNRKASPDERTGSLMLLCVAAVMMAALFRVYSGRNSFGGEGSVLNYIGHGDWDRGINIFAVSSVMVLLCQVILILVTLKFIASLAGKFLGAKGHTVCTLLYNIVFCITMVVFVMMTLEYFGVNTQALVASFGLAGLAASLGAKDFVSDIIAGITLMTDGSYKVGDTIEIDDFRGTVLKINMRKTTVLQWQGTVKTFSNSTITSVINHSLYPYTCFLTFTIPKECTVKKAEEIIGRELPKLKNQCPGIIEGPSYVGVSEVKILYGSLWTTLAVQAVCKFKDRFTVNYFLTRNIKMMFEEEFDETITIYPPFPPDESRPSL